MPAKRSRDLTLTCGLLIEAASYLQRGLHDDVERATGLSGAWLEVLLRLHRTPGGALRINEIAEQVSVNVLGATASVFLLKVTDPIADCSLDFALGFHRADNSETVAKICNTFPKSPGLTKW